MAGKYQAYSVYEDRDGKWFGRVPMHWDSAPIKFQCTYNDDVLSESLGDDYEIEYVDIGSVSANEGIQKVEKIPFGNAPSRARRVVRDGDVIVSTVRTYLEAIAPIKCPPDNLVVSTGFAVIRPNLRLHKKYAAYALRAKGFIDEVVARSVGISYPAINASDLVAIYSPIPSLGEQEQIANFLDHETAKIGTLIDKQQQLIKLLKEKQQTVSSHAVTKGLNPDAAMKDSGVAWLGEVPKHWKVSRLKYFKDKSPNSFVDGPFGSNLKSEHFIDDGDVYVIESNFATTGNLVTEKLKTISNEHFETIKRSSTQGGDIIIAKIGARYGYSSILPKLDRNAVVSGNSLKLTVNDALVQRDYAHSLLIYLKLNDAMDDGVNVTAQPALSLGALNNLPFVAPPLEEQAQIIDHVVRINKQFIRLISSAEKSITLSQERRTALISAAVTGKIDVRNWQPAQTEIPREASA